MERYCFYLFIATFR